MVLAELFSLALYLISLFVLHEYFGKFNKINLIDGGEQVDVLIII